MARKIQDFLVKSGASLIAADSFRIVLDKASFDSGLAAEVDSTIYTFGIFDIESLDGKDKFKSSFPMQISLNVFKRTAESDKIYLYYEKNNIVIDNMTYFQNAKAAIAFLGLLTSGKFNDLSAAELTRIFKQNMKMNGTNTRVPSELVEAMISELVRWKQDVSIPFRLKYGQVPDDDYVLLNIKDISRVTSVFGAISFEDVKKALQAAVYMTRTDQVQTRSPIESVMHN